MAAPAIFGRSRPAPPTAAREADAPPAEAKANTPSENTASPATAVAPQEAAEQFIPLPSFRVGVYASSGIPVFGGFIDYINHLNEVEGGINGVKLVLEECETEWTAERGVECYERFRRGKQGDKIAIYNPNGCGKRPNCLGAQRSQARSAALHPHSL